MSYAGETVGRLTAELVKRDRRLVVALLAMGLVAALTGLLRRTLAHPEAPAEERLIVAGLAAAMAAGLFALLRRPDRVAPVRAIVCAGVVVYMMVRFASLLFFRPHALGPPQGFVLWLPIAHFLVSMSLPRRAALRTSLGLVGLQGGLFVVAAATVVPVTPGLQTWMAQILLVQLTALLLLHFLTLRQEQLARTAAWAERLEALAHTDHLTGLANRRSLEEALGRETARAERLRASLAVILVDLDRFKAVNDDLGHEAGDRVLEGAAARIRSALRQSDLPGRFGGEEFLVIAAGAERSGAHALAERLLERMRAPGLLPARTVTASAGVAVHRPGEPPDRLLRRADDALYRAKAAGRDRAVAAP